MSVRGWRTHFVTLVLFLGVGTAMVGSAQDAQDEDDGPVWQESQSAVVKLGIRDKFGDLGRYSVCFVVWVPDGRMLTVTRDVENDESRDVYFPDDFDAYVVPGEYTWEGRVGGKKVVGGTFEFKSRKFHCDTVRMVGDWRFHDDER